MKCRTHTKTPALFSILNLHNIVVQKTFWVMHMRRPCRKKNKIPNEQPVFGCQPTFGSHSHSRTNKLFSSFFFMSITFASRTHDGKGTFFMIFERFSCVRWSEYTTEYIYLTSTNRKHLQLMTTYNNSHCQTHLLADLITIPLMYNLVFWNNFLKKKKKNTL